MLDADSGLFAWVFNIVDSLQIIGPQISLKEFLAEWGAITPTSHSDQTIAILHQSVDNVTHCVWSTVCLSPILCCKVVWNKFHVKVCLLSEMLSHNSRCLDPSIVTKLIASGVA
jgi:hypothetical protein